MFAVFFLCAGWPLSLQSGIVETFDGRRIVGQATFETNAVLRIVAIDGRIVTVPLTNVLLATMASSTIDLAEFKKLPAGWTNFDIGRVGMAGRAGTSNLTFALRVASGEIGDESDSFHFVSHELPGDGMISARVTALQGGDLLARCGLMIRQSTNANAPFVFVSCNGAGGVNLQTRAGAGEKASPPDATEKIPLPHWLKLDRNGVEFVASKSSDGVNWQEIARTNLALNGPALVGLALSSHGDLALSTATFDQAQLAMPGLFGEYFAKNDFKQLRWSRVDPGLSFDWREETPAPGLSRGEFSVRWSGEIVPKYSEEYQFFWDADDEADLWINNQAMSASSFKRGRRREGKGITLTAGRRYPLRLEFKQGDGAASIQLGWESDSQPRELLTAPALVATLRPSVPLPPGGGTQGRAAVRGLLLRDGSFIAGVVEGMDDTAARLQWRGSKLTVATHKIAAVNFRLPAREFDFQSRGKRGGVLLDNGDFFDGEVRSIDGRRVVVNSVLFGLRSFGIDTGEVIAAMLSTAVPEAYRFELQIGDGTLLRAMDLLVAGDAVVAQNSLLGVMRFPAQTVVELRGKR